MCYTCLCCMYFHVTCAVILSVVSVIQFRAMCIYRLVAILISIEQMWAMCLFLLGINNCALYAYLCLSMSNGKYVCYMLLCWSICPCLMIVRYVFCVSIFIFVLLWLNAWVLFVLFDVYDLCVLFKSVLIYVCNPCLYLHWTTVCSKSVWCYFDIQSVLIYCWRVYQYVPSTMIVMFALCWSTTIWHVCVVGLCGFSLDPCSKKQGVMC